MVQGLGLLGLRVLGLRLRGVYGPGHARNPILDFWPLFPGLLSTLAKRESVCKVPNDSQEKQERAGLGMMKTPSILNI